MNIIKIIIITLIFYIFYVYYNKKEPQLKSILKKTKKQYYKISSITHDVITKILTDNFLKYKHSGFNLSNLPTTSRQLKLSEADALSNSVTNVFNKSLKDSFIKLRLIQAVPLYKIETDVESNYSLQLEYEIKALDETISVENRVIRLQLNIVIQKKNIEETFFDRVIIGKNDNQIEKIFITQIKEISTMDNTYQLSACSIKDELAKVAKHRERETNGHYTKTNY